MSRLARTTLRTLALLGTTALTAGALGAFGIIAAPGFAAPAFAAPGDGGTGSITVHKHEQTSAPLGPNDGTELDLSGQSVNPLVAGFRSCTIGGIDLATQTDWLRLKNLVVTAAPNPALPPIVTESGTQLPLTCGAEQLTQANDGTTTFAGLAADRAYVLFESASPDGALKVAAPAIVTVPYPGTQAGTWNSHPHIYPKNVIVGSGATKTSAAQFGVVYYTITVPIKPLPQGETYSEFIIEDQLSPDLTYARAATVKLTSSTGSAVPLTQADYTLTGDLNTSKTKLVLTLSPSGLAKLDANIEGKLVLRFGTQAVTSNNANTALVKINGSASVNQRAHRSGSGSGVETPGPGWSYPGQHYEVFVKDPQTGARLPVAGAGIQTYMHPDRTATSCPASPAEMLSHPDWDDGFLGPAPEDNLSDTTGISWIAGIADLGLLEGPYCGYIDIMPQGYKGVTGPYLHVVTGPDGTTEVELFRVDIIAGDMPPLPETGAAGNIFLGVGGAALVLGSGVLIIARHRTASRG
ncbi:Fimbrial subunit type 2 precursor [Leucobacter sp. 7(1)]|uniref:SpaH/EbpB family LPXTG-anchored major pilin n=1 Tax=Leucobacter sp. 7(1) TaxID=1255613 RepID=UPI00097ED212|nr:SpaH/EbpB family LPXTG-anchored major pilin [Leucobacter sp. 7(1)]SJN08494.1 Fimbrial subunit type 2 precursor [Leucobacter sp. 7(1)]